LLKTRLSHYIGAKGKAMDNQPIKVLLIEAETSYANVLRSTLADGVPARFELEHTDQLDDARRRLSAGRFDGILLDLALPAGGGLEAFKQLHALAPAVPIIVMASVADEKLALEAVRLGAQDYLVKGQIHGKMLARVIRYAIERKQAEETLREREEFFRLILENVTDLIAVLGRDGKRLYNSPSYKNLLGEPAGLRGTDSFADIHPEDKEKVRKIFQETLTAGTGQRAEYRFLFSDGRVRHVESVGSVIKDPAGEVSKVVVVSRDITERRRSEELIRNSEALYHSLVESLPQNIFRKDVEGRFTFVNQRFCATLGKSMEDILGRSDCDFFPPELAAKYQKDDHYVMQTGRIFETVEENQPPTGGKLYVHVVKIPVYDAHGSIIGIQGIFWDITEQKRAEESLRQTLLDLKKSHQELKATQQQLLQAAKLESVGTLAAGVAHEVKNPLQTILMAVQYLSKNLPASDENIALVLTDMRDAVQRANSIVRGLLEFSAANQPDVKDEDLNGILDHSLRLLKYEFDRTHIAVVKEFQDPLPLLRLEKNKMQQVFINLLMNAIHAMPQGGTLTVRTRTQPATDISRTAGRTDGLWHGEDQLVVIEIEDTGTGIPEENLTKIFDPFFTTKPTGLGTGLGLPVTKKIIELHGGAIDIKNRGNGGVSVSIMFKP
jgi:PAS domain S-box-containing protein